MTEKIKNRIEKIEDLEKRLFWGIFSLVVLMFGAYGFLAIKMNVNGIRVDGYQKEIGKLSSKVGLLETDYLKLKNGITAELAYSKGFVNTKDQAFVSINSVPKTITLNE